MRRTASHANLVISLVAVHVAGAVTHAEATLSQTSGTGPDGSAPAWSACRGPTWNSSNNRLMPSNHGH